MTTSRTRGAVSTVATLLITLALGACASGASHSTTAVAPVADAYPLSISFVNDGREYVHVYLIGERREWMLGRVEPGARAALALPKESVESERGYVRLAVVSGARMTLQAARDPRARITIAQRPTSIMTQEWRFAQGQLTSLHLPGIKMYVGPR